MSPTLRGRVDIDKFNKGLQECENFIPTVHGPLRYREGTQYARDVDSGNIRLINYTINNQERYLLVLSAEKLSILPTGAALPPALYSKTFTSSDVPYQNDEIPDVRYSYEAGSVVFTHPKHPPYILERGDPNVVISFAATFKPMKFTSHPFQKIDTSNTVLSLTNEQERVRLVSDANEWGSLNGVDLNANEHYTEYKVGNQWGLARVMAYISAKEVLVDPVESVVNIEDPSVRLALLDNDDGSSGANDPWLTNDRVPAGKVHIRADTLIFRTSHLNSWVRIGGDKLFTNVCKPDAASESYNSQDDKIRWAKITDYRGVEDHPIDFIYGSLLPTLFSSGEVYQVYRWSSATGDDRLTGIFIFDGSGFNKGEDATAIVGRDAGQERFAMNATLWVSGYNDPFNHTSSDQGYATTKGSSVRHSTVPVGYADDMIVANMSTQRQFDVVEVESSTVRTDGVDLIVTSGNVIVYDLTNDPEQFKATPGSMAYHTATLSSSHDFFDTTDDVGRYVYANMISGWVLMRIRGDMTTDSVSVDVLNSIPRNPLTDELMNNGVFTQFRMGAWYVGNYPKAVAYYEQRRVFAGSLSEPSSVWFSNLEDDTDFRPTEDDGQVIDTSGITYKLGTNSSTISWLQTGPTLIIGTESNEWQIRPNEFSGALSPRNLRITQETSIGSNIEGIRIGSSLFFPHISGKQLSEFRYNFELQQFVTETVTKLVPNLFDNDPIKALSYQYNPNSCIWIVTENGALYTLTYRKEDDAYAWASHSTGGGGKYREVVVIPKGDSTTSEDQVWFIIDRGGSQYLEKLSNSFTAADKDFFSSSAHFLDSYTLEKPDGGFTPPGQATFSAYSRQMIDGKVRVVVDGVDLGNVTVTDADGATNDLPGGKKATTFILVGIPYTGYVRPNPIAFQEPGSGNSYGQIKRMVSAKFYLYNSISFDLGSDVAEGHQDETELRYRTETIVPQSPDIYVIVPLFTGFTEDLVFTSQFNNDQTPLIIQNKPYPLTLVSAILKVDKF